MNSNKDLKKIDFKKENFELIVERTLKRFSLIGVNFEYYCIFSDPTS